MSGTRNTVQKKVGTNFITAVNRSDLKYGDALLQLHDDLKRNLFHVQHVNKNQLRQIVALKHSALQARPNTIERNADADIIHCSEKALTLLTDGHLNQALKVMIEGPPNIIGIGATTATIIFSLVHPDKAVIMTDEILSCLMDLSGPDGRITGSYTGAMASKVFNMCKNKAEELNRMMMAQTTDINIDADTGDVSWTANDVQWAIWTEWQLGAGMATVDMD